MSKMNKRVEGGSNKGNKPLGEKDNGLLRTSDVHGDVGCHVEHPVGKGVEEEEREVGPLCVVGPREA